METFLGILAAFFGLLFCLEKSNFKDYKREYGKLSDIKRNLDYEHTKLDDKRAKLAQDEQILNLNIKNANERKQFIEAFLSSKIKDYPIVASVLADYMTAYDDVRVKQLENKKRPALKASEEVRKIKAEKRELIANNKAMKWELKYLKELYPIIGEIEEDPIAEQESYINPDYQHEDKAGLWLTPQEYAALPTVDKYQRALDRYMHRKKTNREIGLEYERYIGYLYEQEGYNVTYHGIEKGFEDLGRDLICKKDGYTDIVQCKCWSKKKQIHENHINQLYGTTIMYKIKKEREAKGKNNRYNLLIDMEEIISPVFVSTTELSETALTFAKYLGINVKIIPLKPYPIIKCNISQRTGEKIYHLPFDQQYDRCIINPKSGEFYAMTIAEAEAKGFRRAMRWHGNKT